ncbi:hypothetical protein OEZ85_002938 [Tetradesmus obliquus]|uniref:Uncharacterized protein n=1 Tax=Tetradesmus obliquus TaxID=3088 RepID=A0ABY8TZI5_TETOB|nr:hypothetical protein OEZ85_002938 [Tetradesmus obliquus]
MMRLFVMLLLVALGDGRVLLQAHGVADTLNAQVAGMAAHDAIAKAVANGGRNTVAATRKGISLLPALRQDADGMAAQDAIGKAVASAGKNTAAATRKGVDYAQLAGRGGVQPYMFDDTGARRHLLQASYQRSDKMQMAGMAAQDAIGKAVASAGKNTAAATRKGVDYAQLAGRGGVQPYMFDDTGARRHLLQASYQRSDKMQMAGMAAQDAIGKAVASAGKNTAAATRKGVDYAQLAGRGGVQPYMFDDTGARRHLLQASYQRSDKMQMAGMAAQDAIGKAVASAGKNTIAATRKGVDYAQLAGRGGVQPYMFDDTGARR